MRGSVGLCGYVDLAAKGTYYLNLQDGAGSISGIAFKGSGEKMRIMAVCGYL